MPIPWFYCDGIFCVLGWRTRGIGIFECAQERL
jgi:hypothetical protein